MYSSTSKISLRIKRRNEYYERLNKFLLLLIDHSPLDTIQEAMGSLGRWHIIIAVAISLVKFPVAWHQLSIIFLAPPVNFTCVTPASVDNASRWMQCHVNDGNGTKDCTGFEYDRSIFKETIVTQVEKNFFLFFI